MIQIENRAEESDDGEDDDHAAYYLIDNYDAVGIKFVPNLVDEPGESEPPQQGSEDDAEIPYSHFYRHIRYDESKLREGGHEEEHDERIGECNEKSRNKVVKISAFAARNRTDGLHRIAPESIDTECQQQNAAKKLQIKDVFIHIVEYETHSVSSQQRIEYIAKRRAYTCHETIPASLVQRTLYAKHPYRTQRCRHDDTYNKALPQYVQYGFNLNHGCKDSANQGKYKAKNEFLTLVHPHACPITKADDASKWYMKQKQHLHGS